MAFTKSLSGLVAVSDVFGNSAYAEGVIYACWRSITHACQVFRPWSEWESARLSPLEAFDRSRCYVWVERIISTRLVTFRPSRLHLPRDTTLCPSPS